MAKHRISKAKCQTIHFKRRCEERLGEQVDRKALQRRIRERIFDENFYFFDKQTNRVTRYRYRYKDKWYIIPYDKNRKKVITIYEDKNQDIMEILTETKKDFRYYFDLVLNFIKNFFKK